MSLNSASVWGGGGIQPPVNIRMDFRARNPTTFHRRKRCSCYTKCEGLPWKISRVVVTSQTQYSLANARSYFSEHLAIGDYFAESNQAIGEWLSAAAQRLGLGVVARSEPSLRLCENQNPTFDPRELRSL